MPSPDAPMAFPDGDAQLAIRMMVNHPFLETKRYQEQQWRANRLFAHPEILDFEKALIRELAKLGIPMFAHCVVRTPEEQARVIAEGFSRGNVEEYPHQRCAVDIIHSQYGWNLVRTQWDVIGHIGKEVARKRGLKIQWGGDWKRPYDPAHWQLANWRERAKGWSSE